MSRFLAWPFLLSLVAALGSLALVERLWRVRDRPGAGWLLATLVAQSLFCLVYAVALTVADPTLRYGLEVVAIVCFNALGVPFLGFALAYTGRSSLLDSWYFRALFVFPVLTVVLLPFNASHGLFWTDFTVETTFGVVGATYTTQPLLFVTVLGGTLGAGLGALLLVETFLSYGPLYRREALAVALSPLAPTVGLLAWLFQFGPVPELNVTAILFLPHVLFDADALVWSDMFEYHPATSRAAERSAIEDLGSPVVVLDEQGRVVDLNGGASALLDTEDPITRPIESVLGTDVSLDEDQRLVRQQGGQRRTFRLRPAPLTDSGDNHVGYTLVFQDISEEMRREQRLSVLNRVLRHNLRNDMTVVKGNVALAQEKTDGGVVTNALTSAQQKAEDLISTSEKARTVAETIREASDDTFRVDISSRCRTIADHYREQYPSATISVAGPAELLAETSPTVLTTVIENLVENALVHGGDEPTVEIAVERRDDALVCITVADDGPGIPDSELETIHGGEETDLKHGSGVGLWVVKWGGELLGHDVSFDVDETGTTATVCLTDQRQTADETLQATVERTRPADEQESATDD